MKKQIYRILSVALICLLLLSLCSCGEASEYSVKGTKENGKTVWRTFESQVRETVGLSEDGKQIYSKTMNDSIVCFATQGDEPKKLWASNVGFGYEHAPSMPQEKEGVMYGSTKEGLIFALDAQTGKVIWKHKIGNSLINTVVPLNKKEVLFTATSGEVGLLRMK